MTLKIGYRLSPEEIQTTIANIEHSSNDLVKKVLAEETTFRKECKKLEDYAKKEFYQKRDELVEALNHYNFFGIIGGDKKKMLDYEVFHLELKKLKKKKTKLKITAWSGLPGATGLTYLAFIVDPFLLGPMTAILGCMGGVIASTVGAAKTYDLNSILPSGFIVLKTYYDLKAKSKDADKFMQDYQILKEKYLPLYKVSNKDSDSTPKILSNDSDF